MIDEIPIENTTVEKDQAEAIEETVEEKLPEIPEEVKPKKKVQQEPRAKLNADSLLSELSQLNQADFDRLLKTPHKIIVGEEVEGTIIRIQKDLYIVDVGAKSEAFLSKDLAEKQHLVHEKLVLRTSVSGQCDRVSVFTIQNCW